MTRNNSESLTMRRIPSPIGELQLFSDGHHIVRINFPNEGTDPAAEGNDPVLDSCASQLAEYFPDVVEGLLGGARTDEELDAIRPPFNREAFDEASQKIADLYRDAGYLSVNIVSEVNRSA